MNEQRDISHGHVHTHHVGIPKVARAAASIAQWIATASVVDLQRANETN